MASTAGFDEALRCTLDDFLVLSRAEENCSIARALDRVGWFCTDDIQNSKTELHASTHASMHASVIFITITGWFVQPIAPKGRDCPDNQDNNPQKHMTSGQSGTYIAMYPKIPRRQRASGEPAMVGANLGSNQRLD